MRLNKFTAQGQGGTAQNPRMGLRENSGLQSLGEDLQRTHDEIQAVRDADDFSRARLAMEKGFLDLAEQYKDVDQLDGFKDRASQDLETLRGNVLDGTNKRVRQKMEELFDVAAVRSHSEHVALVTKNEGRRRVADFEGQKDELLNAILNAGQDKKQLARDVLNQRVATLKPFMDPVKYAQLLNGIDDYLEYEGARRAIPAAVAKGQTFDPAKYPKLGAGQLGQLEAYWKAEERRQTRERAEHERDRMAVLKPELDDSIASMMVTGEGSPDHDAKLQELAGLGEAGAKDAAKYREQGKLVSKVFDTLDAVKGQDFSQQMAAVDTLKPEAGSERFKVKHELWDRARKQLETRYNSFVKDPAGYVAQEIADRAEKNNVSSQEARIDMSFEAQKKLGNPRPKVFAKAAAAEFKAAFKAADPAGKAKMTAQVQGYGKHTRQALLELDLGVVDEMGVMVFAEGNSQLGKKIFSLNSQKINELGGDSESAKAIRKTVNTDFYSSGMGAVLRKQAMATGNGNYLEMADKLEELTLKNALMHGDAAAAAKELWGDRFDFVNNDHAAIWVPKGHDADRFEHALFAARALLASENEGFTDGVWQNDEDGRGYVLFSPVLGKVLGTDNKPRILTADEIMKALDAEKLARIRRRNVAFAAPK